MSFGIQDSALVPAAAGALVFGCSVRCWTPARHPARRDLGSAGAVLPTTGRSLNFGDFGGLPKPGQSESLKG